MAIITGTNNNDNLTGTAEDDVITGLGGNDNLRGLGGNDSLDGGEGNDNLLPGLGNDSVIGGPGNDELRIDYSTETQPLLLNQSGILGVKTESIEQAGVIGSRGNDLIDASNITSQVGLHGHDGDDYLIGTSGNDEGGMGYDILYGWQSGLHGGNGDDTLDGREGNDNLLPGLGNDSVIGGPGNDELRIDYSTETQPLLLNQSGILGVKTESIEQAGVIGSRGNDLIDASNITSQVGLHGHDGDDYLIGTSGNDEGGMGYDILYGWQSGLHGGNGNDTLVGVNPEQTNPGQGERDYLQGDEGADLYILGDLEKVYYSYSGNNDYATIVTFNPNQDKVQLNGNLSDYSLTTSNNNTNLLRNNELIAVFSNVTTGINLESDTFVYISPHRLPYL